MPENKTYKPYRTIYFSQNAHSNLITAQKIMQLSISATIDEALDFYVKHNPDIADILQQQKTAQ